MRMVIVGDILDLTFGCFYVWGTYFVFKKEKQFAKMNFLFALS